MFKGFKAFLMRGNVVDLAVAVVLGGAFGAVVSSFVADVFNPLLAAVVGKPDFSALALDVNGSQVKYGLFLNALIAFLLVAAAIYFFVVVPINTLDERKKRGAGPADPTTKKCGECLTEIPVAAKRCSACCSPAA